jgi:hypothetical protein
MPKIVYPGSNEPVEIPEVTDAPVSETPASSSGSGDEATSAQVPGQQDGGGETTETESTHGDAGSTAEADASSDHAERAEATVEHE